MALALPNMNAIRERDPELHQTLRAIVAGIGRVETQTNSDASATQAPPPEQVFGLNVTEKDGIHDIQIADPSPGYRGKNYFAEYARADDPSNFHKIDLGSSQNHRANLGSGQYIWRAHSSYGTSDPSDFVYHGGSTPVAVGSGDYAGPPMQPRRGPVAFGPVFTSASAAPPVRQ